MIESRRKLTFYRCWAIAMPTLLFSLMTDTMHMAIFYIVVAGISLLRQQPIKITLRTVIYSIVLSLTIIVLFNTLVKIGNRFFLTPSELGVPTAIVFALALTFFDERPTITSTILIFSVFALMMSGDVVDGHRVINLPFTTSLWRP